MASSDKNVTKTSCEDDFGGAWTGTTCTMTKQACDALTTNTTQKFLTCNGKRYGGGACTRTYHSTIADTYQDTNTLSEWDSPNARAPGACRIYESKQQYPSEDVNKNVSTGVGFRLWQTFMGECTADGLTDGNRWSDPQRQQQCRPRNITNATQCGDYISAVWDRGACRQGTDDGTGEINQGRVHCRCEVAECTAPALKAAKCFPTKRLSKTTRDILTAATGLQDDCRRKTVACAGSCSDADNWENGTACTINNPRATDAQASGDMPCGTIAGQCNLTIQKNFRTCCKMPPRCREQVTTAACDAVTLNAVFNPLARNERCGSSNCDISRSADGGGFVSADYLLCCQDPQTCNDQVSDAVCNAVVDNAVFNAAAAKEPCGSTICDISRSAVVGGVVTASADFNLCCTPPPTCGDEVTTAACHAVTPNAVFNPLARNERCGSSNCDISRRWGGSAMFSADYLLCCQDPTTTSSITSTSVPYWNTNTPRELQLTNQKSAPSG